MRLLESSLLRLCAGSFLALGVAAGAARADSVAVEALREAGADAARGDWEGAFAAAEAGGPLVRDLLEWQALKGSETEWREVAGFIAAHPDWPDLDDLRANGETSIPDGADPAEVLAYFGDEAPQTGAGARALARALIALDREDEARAMLEALWLKQPLAEAGVALLAESFPEWLGPLHAARADAMLWRWRTADAERMLPLLSDERRALVRARMAMIRNGSAGDLLDAVPAALRDDPGLAYDRFNRLAEDGDFTAALAILRAHDGSAESLGEPYRWGAWRAQIVRWLLREGRDRAAYRLAAGHHIEDPSEIHADLEWLAGFAALRRLDDPEAALAHFRASAAQVTGPISSSRAAYWEGRALEAMGDAAGAEAAYARGSLNQTAFYGLLSAEKLGLSLDPTLTGRESFGDWRESARMRRDLPQAMLLLLAAGERDEALRFALQMARSMDRTGLGQLANLLHEMREPYIAVLVGKAAAERGVIVPAAYFPLHPLAAREWPVEADLALSIARRESEFNPGAASPVGAQGLMQLMPATARETAGWLGLAYSAPRMLEWRYNAALGTRYLEELQSMLGSSPVLVAAGYNAGPGRPRQWMAERGDFRRGQGDVVDFIEMIPFAETRIYVMRVTESIPIYRARLTGFAGPIEFTALLNGEPPHVRPRPRPEGFPSATLVAALGDGSGAPRAPVEAPVVERVSTSSAPPAIAAEVAAEQAAAEAARLPSGAPVRPVPRPDAS